jgi:phosphopantothenoylcysteine synthetase/decarboxylase
MRAVQRRAHQALPGEAPEALLLFALPHQSSLFCAEGTPVSVQDRRILVTSGPTRAPLDAVRFFTNKSTGRLGALIAEVAVQGGADVTFVYGRGSDTPVARGGHAITCGLCRSIPSTT